MSFLKIELHCHVKLLSRGAFRPGQLRRQLNWAARLGLHGLAVTEHFDVPDFREIYRHLEALCANGGGGELRWGKLAVLAGTEITIEEGGDILFIGSADALRKLAGRLGGMRAKILRREMFPPFQDLLDASEDLGFLRIGAHPCRREKVLWKMDALLKRLDALEINAGELALAGLVRRQAEQLGVGVVAGSDAHHWLQIGRLVRQGRFAQAMFFLGAATHLLQDVCEPHHASCRFRMGHRDYEKWVQEHKEDYLVDSGGVYKKSRDPVQWLKNCARKSYTFLELVKENNLTYYRQAATSLLPLTQRVTAGFWLNFLNQAGVDLRPDSWQVMKNSRIA